MSSSEEKIEREIMAKGLTAPRLNPARQRLHDA